MNRASFTVQHSPHRSDYLHILDSSSERIAVARDERQAHLFAAAPDLLSSLESLCSICDSSLDYRPEFRAAIGNAHAVIAKAKGGAA